MEMTIGMRVNRQASENSPQSHKKSDEFVLFSIYQKKNINNFLFPFTNGASIQSPSFISL
jgi:hypothetical protein